MSAEEAAEPYDLEKFALDAGREEFWKEYFFTVAGQRRYWRMQEMNNPEERCCDYVNIYFD